MNIRGITAAYAPEVWPTEPEGLDAAAAPEGADDCLEDGADGVRGARGETRQLARSGEMEELDERRDGRRGGRDPEQPHSRASTVAGEALSVAEWATTRGDDRYRGAILAGDRHSPDWLNAADEYATQRARDAVVNEAMEAAGERIFGRGAGGLIGVLVEVVAIPTDSPYSPRNTPREILEMEAVAAWERTYGPSGEAGRPALETMLRAYLGGETTTSRSETSEGERRSVIMGAPAGHRTGFWGGQAGRNRGDQNRELSPGRGRARSEPDDRTAGGEDDPNALRMEIDRDRGSRSTETGGGDPDPDDPDAPAEPGTSTPCGPPESGSSSASGEVTADDAGASFRQYDSVEDYENGEEGEDLQLPPSPEVRRRRTGDRDDLGRRPQSGHPDTRPQKQRLEEPVLQAVGRKTGEDDEERPDVGAREGGQSTERDLEDDLRGKLREDASGGEAGPIAPKVRVLEPGDPVEGF